MRLRRARNADFGALQETFLVCAASTILIIRTESRVTNYPQLGGHGLHIAHLLWGGLLMLVAIGILVTFLGRAPRRTAAVVGGVGFGFFIDELGKFVTSDNNYFFKPAAAMIYALFIGLFLPTARCAAGGDCRLRSERRTWSSCSARPRAEDSASRTVGARAALLDGADSDDRLVAGLRDLVTQLDARPVLVAGPFHARGPWAGQAFRRGGEPPLVRFGPCVDLRRLGRALDPDGR